MSWAADEPAAAGETFNITNGEVFEFRDMWPALAATLGVEVGPDESLSLAEYLPARSATWDEVVRANGLRPIELHELLGESHHYADMCFAYGAPSAPPPTYLSTVKLKQAGFNGAYDTEASFCHWLRVLMDRQILRLPPSDRRATMVTLAGFGRRCVRVRDTPPSPSSTVTPWIGKE